MVRQTRRPEPFDLAAAAPGLHLDGDGLWRASTPAGPPYVASQAAVEVEDGSFWFRYRNERIVETVRRFPPAGTLVDIGGGNGFVARGLTQAGFPVVVVEPAGEAARHAADRGLDPVVCATLDDAGFVPGSLPAVGLFDVLAHQADDTAVLASIARALRPDGRLYLTVPAYAWLWSDDDAAAGHQRRYTRGSLTRVVEAAGFALETDTYLFAPLLLPVLLGRAIPSTLRRRQAAEGEAPAPRPSPIAGDAGALTAWLLDLEAWWFGHVGAVPFGTSVLLVARRR